MKKKLFISHKISEHGEIVKSLITVLNRFESPEHLEIFSSSAIGPGEDYREKIMKTLDETDLFLLLANYSTPPQINDWCIFETGYFFNTADKESKKIICLVKDGGTAPDPIKTLKSVQETRDGIEELIKEIYKGLRDDLFENGHPKEALAPIVDEILMLLKPKTLITELAPRVWITIKKDKFEDFKKGKIPLPVDSSISGETEIFTRKRVLLSDDEELTLEKFDKIVDYPNSLPHFYALLENYLREILSAPRQGPWPIPPLRVMKDTPPRIIVPSALERCADGNYRFEFIVTEPPWYAVHGTNPKFMGLYNLFIITWHFRWRVVERHINQLIRMKDVYSQDEPIEKRKKKQVRKQLRKLTLDIEAIYLDSINRNLEYQEDVTQHFVGIDKKIIKNIVDAKKGLWGAIKPIFDKAVHEENIPEIIKCLEAWRDLNKTVFVLTLKRLNEISESNEVIDGNILTSTTTCENLLASCDTSALDE